MGHHKILLAQLPSGLHKVPVVAFLLGLPRGLCIIHPRGLPRDTP